MHLNREQREVTKSNHKNTLVIACHGAGKSLVACHRAVQESKRWPKNKTHCNYTVRPVLMLTHTKNARDNIEDRIWHISSNTATFGRILVSTFHAFALSILQKYFGIKFIEKGRTDMLVLDTIRSDKGLRRFEEKTLKNHLISIYEDHIVSGDTLDIVIKRRYPIFNKRKKNIIRAIRTIKKSLNKTEIISPAEIPTRFIDSINNKNIAKIFGNMPFSLIVDEFQDILDTQWEMIKMIAKNGARIFAIGDPGQSIFTWAGSSSNRFNQFRKHFKSHEEYVLRINHRSSRQIVRFCANIRKQVGAKYDVKSKSKFGSLKPLIVCSDSEKKLCDYLVKYLLELREAKESLDDIAIIYRYHSNRRIITPHLELNNIPYKVYQKNKRRIRPAIRLIFCIERIIKSIQKEDISSEVWDAWRVVLKYVEGIGDKSVEKIVQWLQKRSIGDSTYPKKTRFTESLKDLLEFIDESVFDSYDLMPDEFLSDIVKMTEKLPKLNKSNIDRELSSLFYLAIKNQHLRDAIDQYQDTSYPTCYPAGRMKPPFPYEYITLSSIHRIKGSEFKTVIYLGTGDELYEKYRCFEGKNKTHEILLMNVASSRAKQNLMMLFPVRKETWVAGTEVQNPWTIIRRTKSKYYKIKHI